MTGIVCRLVGHDHWDTSDCPSVPAESVCRRCGELDADGGAT